VEWDDGSLKDRAPYLESRLLGNSSDVNDQLDAKVEVCRNLVTVCHARAVDIHVLLVFVVPQ
jgi:hypothetical protein